VNIELLIGLIPGVGALIISAFALLQKTAESRRNDKLVEAANIVTGYSQLVDDLQKQIECNNTELVRLRRELEELRTTAQRDRETWEQERADLQLQISELQEENRRLRKQLDEVQRYKEVT